MVSEVQMVTADDCRAAIARIESKFPRLVGRGPECCNWYEEADLSPEERAAAICRDDWLFLLGAETRDWKETRAETKPLTMLRCEVRQGSGWCDTHWCPYTHCYEREYSSPADHS